VSSFFADVSDETILFGIYDNSVMAADILNTSGNSFNIEEPPLAAIKYTIIKTEMTYFILYFLKKLVLNQLH